MIIFWSICFGFQVYINMRLMSESALIFFNLNGDAKQIIVDVMTLGLIFELDNIFGSFYISVLLRLDPYGKKIV